MTIHLADHLLTMWLVVLLGAGLVWALAELGWLSAPKPWEIATGWNRIPEALRPRAAAPPGPGEPLVRWLGHAGMVVRWDDTVLLLDPNVSTRCTVSRRVMESPASPAGLGRVDAALVSHAHYDHLNQHTLTSIPGLKTVVLPAGSEVFLDEPAARRLAVIPLALGQVCHIGNLDVIPVSAAHNGNRHHPWRTHFHAFGTIIRNAAGRTIYFAGDTAFANDWAAIRDAWQPEMAMLPIGAYAPRVALKRHHLNPEEAVAAARILGVRQVIPCHMGTFRLSFDRPDSALPRFARAAAAAGLNWSMPILLRESDLALFARNPEIPPP